MRSGFIALVDRNATTIHEKNRKESSIKMKFKVNPGGL